MYQVEKPNRDFERRCHNGERGAYKTMMYRTSWQSKVPSRFCEIFDGEAEICNAHETKGDGKGNNTHWQCSKACKIPRCRGPVAASVGGFLSSQILDLTHSAQLCRVCVCSCWARGILSVRRGKQRTPKCGKLRTWTECEVGF